MPDGRPVEPEVQPVPHRDVHRAIVRLIQELEAIDWYHAPIGVVALDAQGLILAWNGTAGEILGVREWEVLGTSLLHLFHESGRAELDALITRCITTDIKCPPTVFERRPPGGPAQFVEVTASGLRSRTGETGATVLLQDVTHRVEAERAQCNAERRFRSLLRWMDAVVWEARPEDRAFTFVSERAGELLGYPVEDWLGQPAFWVSRVHPDDRTRAITDWHRATAEGQDHELEYRMVAADGRVIWVRDRITAIRDADGRPERLLGIMVDVTERKRTEESLARLYTRAEDEARRKEQFLASLAHELRTPLSAVGAALAVLERVPMPDAAAQSARDVIGRQVRVVSQLMDELLDVARVTTGKVALDREPVDLLEIVRQGLHALGERMGARAADVALVADGSVSVSGDRARLQQVVTNLVDNAVKFTTAGQRITVTVGRDGDAAMLRVRDDGAGIPGPDLPRIFEPYFQSGEPSRGGLGLGLAVVRRLVELHEGTVEVSSDGPGSGCEFLVRLPASDRGQRRAETRAPDGSARRILVIDDDADTRALLKVLLEGEGYAVELAEDGPRGIEASRAGHHDAIILDIALPGLGGFEVVRHLGVRGQARPYLIALTGYAGPDGPRQATATGFDAYLVKPVAPVELLRLLAAALAR